MVVNAFSAQGGYLGLHFMKNCLRFCDSGCGCDGKITKKKTMRYYMNLYIGPNFDIGARYSEVIFYCLA